jgi:hypothetical protein
MPIRRLALIALFVTLLVQTGFIAAYHRATDGCFCWVTGTPNPPPQPDYVKRFIQVSAYPLGQVGGPNALYLPGAPRVAEVWAGALLYAGVNGFFWFDGLFMLMAGTVLLSRIRVRRRPDSSMPRLGWIHLADPVRVRARWLVLGVLVLVVAGLAGGARYRRWWIGEAQRLAGLAILSERTGSRLPANLDLNPWGIFTDVYQADDLAGPFALLPNDECAVATGDLNSFVAPTEWVAEARFANGTRLEVIVWRGEDDWKVMLSQVEARGEAGRSVED